MYHLQAFQQEYNVSVPSMVTVIGDNNITACGTGDQACGEAALDIQYITALAQGAETDFITFQGPYSWIREVRHRYPCNTLITVPHPGPRRRAPLLLLVSQWIKQVLSDPSPALVHSISWDAPEDLTYSAYDTYWSTAIAKLGAMGITVLVASGDSGVYQNGGSFTSASQCNGTSIPAFLPSFPATSPYVVAVGATMGPEWGLEELACTTEFEESSITTGGGFSNLFSTPTFQQEAVSQYLTGNTSLPPTQLFNRSGRGFPDVAIMGNDYPVALDAKLTAFDGTSASTLGHGALASESLIPCHSVLVVTLVRLLAVRICIALFRQALLCSSLQPS